MDTISELDIERFVRFPNELSEEEFRRIKVYLAEHEEAKAIADWFKNFYSELDHLDRPSIIKLHYFKAKAQPRGPLVLAADSGSPEVELATRATFSSEENGTLVRILEDTRKHQYQIHVLSKFLKQDERVIINIDQQPLDIVTDRGGKIKNIEQKVMSDINWRHASVVLRLPCSTCSYNPDNAEMPFVVCDQCTLNMDGNQVHFSTSEKEITRVLLDQNDQTKLLYLEEQELIFTVDPKEPFTLYLYS